jgi:queuosine biosynthesis protein QueC
MTVMVIFSGGMDSATLLYHLRELGHTVIPVGIDYQQRHRKELAYAMRLCIHLGLAYPVLDLRQVGALLTGSSQTDRSIPVPHGHYQAETMKATVVPNRNMLMLAAAGALAIARRCEAVAYGAHAGDHAIYPDCRSGFIQTMREAFLNCDWEPLQLLTPFEAWTKGQIAREGLRLGVPYELTWTCYEGDEVPCGLCGACVERREAFEEAGAADPALIQG